MRRWWWIVALIAGSIGGVWLASSFYFCSVNAPVFHDPYGHHPGSLPLSKMVKDEGSPFRLDPTVPWWMVFGRGGGLHGFETVRLEYDGRLILHRMKDGRPEKGWETARGQLPPDVVAEVLQAVDSTGILELEKGYYADVADGTQWIWKIRQGDQEKSVFFHNHFPEPIIRFAEQLDSNISETVGPDLQWRNVPYIHNRDHYREL